MRQGAITINNNGMAIMATLEGQTEVIGTYHGNDRDQTIKDLHSMYPYNSTWKGHMIDDIFYINLD